MTVDGSPGKMRSGRWIATLALLYGLLALGSLLLAARPGQVATLWFANAAGTLALLALPARQRMTMLLALALANLLANVAINMPTQGLGAPVWLAAAAFVPGNCAEMALAAWLLARAGIRAADLKHPARLAHLLTVGALVPTLLSALAGAALLANDEPNAFARVWITWFAGSLIGSVAVLPLALSVWLQGWPNLRTELAQLRHQGLLLLTMALTLLAATTLPQPFVIIAMALGLLGATTSFAVTAVGTLLTAVLTGLLIESSVLIPPPSAAWWGDSLYYGAVLATLLPGVFLSATVDSRREAMSQLSASEARLRSLYTQTPAMLHSLDTRGRIINVSRQWLQTMGFAEHEVLGRPATDFLTAESGRYASRLIDVALSEAGRVDVSELQMVRASGDILDVLVSAIWESDAQGKPVRRLAVVQDVTEKKKLAARSHFAEHDVLTGLPNRVLLNDRLERSCALQGRHGGLFALVFLDLDHFKSINDTYGHDAGDLLLKAVARRLQGALRASDTVCRLGGDEFVLLLQDLDGVQQVQGLVPKILHQVAQPCPLGEGADAPVVNVGCSMGVAIFPDHGRDPQTLLLHADQAMYAAKRSGRNRCVIYQPGELSVTP
jgi:diguanylate cyclase (GGDEF)-like protein/PAS domain S-box-containing protein